MSIRNRVDMVDQKQVQKVKILEMAKKRRHIHLLEKMERGRSATPALSKAEIKELEAFEQNPNSPGVVDSQEKVAKTFGVSVRTVQNWTRDSMPVTPQGEYDLLEIRAWRMIKNQRKRKTGKKDGIDWEDRYREYKAKLAEIALKKELGLLIPLNQVEQDLIQICLVVKMALWALPNNIAAQLAGKEAREVCVILRSRIREIILGFAEGAVFQRISQTKEYQKIIEHIKKDNKSS